MFVWVWKYSGSDAPQWSTCFDVMVEGDAKSGGDYSKPASDYSVNAAAAPAPAAPAPVADYAAPPALPATTPAPVVPQKVYEGAVELGDEGFADALLLEFGERGYHSYSAYSLVDGKGSGDGFSWTDPAPAGEVDPLL